MRRILRSLWIATLLMIPMQFNSMGDPGDPTGINKVQDAMLVRPGTNLETEPIRDVFRSFWPQVNAPGGVVWGKPVNLSNTSEFASFPSICVDPSGVAHIVYFAKQKDISDSAAFYYTRLDGEFWEVPIDIVVPKSDTRIIAQPRLTCSEDGFLHLTWVGDFTNQIYTSSAYAPLAYSTKNWSDPVPVGNPSSNISTPYIIADKSNYLHLVYAVQIGGESGIYYSQSTDSGATWQPPDLVYENDRADRMVDHARIAVDEAGELYAAWSEFNYPEVFPPAGIKFSHSGDQGLTWDRVSSLSGPYEFPGVLALGERVHMIWSGTSEERHKFHRFSSDKGITWSPVEITLDIGGFQFWSGMSADSQGRLHIIEPAGSAEGYLIYQMWNNGVWSRPVKMLDHPANYPDNPADTQGTVTDADLAIGLGNMLHAVTTYAVEYSPGNWTWNVFYIPGRIDSPAVAPRELPALSQEALNEEPLEHDSILPTSTIVSEKISEFGPEDEPINDISSTIPILAGILPSIIILVVFLRRRARMRDNS